MKGNVLYHITKNCGLWLIAQQGLMVKENEKYILTENYEDIYRKGTPGLFCVLEIDVKRLEALGEKLTLNSDSNYEVSSIPLSCITAIKYV